MSETVDMLTLAESVIREQDAKIKQLARRQKWGRVVVGSLITAVLVEGLIIVVLK